MSEVSVRWPDTKEMEGSIAVLCEQAKSFKCQGPEDNEAGKKALLEIASTKKTAMGIIDPIKGPLNKAKAALMSLQHRLCGPLDEASETIGKELDRWEREEDLRAKLEAAKIAEEARKAEEESRLLDAAMAEPEEVDAILEAPVPMPVVEPQARVAKVEGVAKTRRPKANVKDWKAALKYIVENCERDPGILTYALPNMPALNRLAVSQRENLSFPGVEVVWTSTYSKRTG